jgi:hypothetical protein
MSTTNLNNVTPRLTRSEQSRINGAKSHGRRQGHLEPQRHQARLRSHHQQRHQPRGRTRLATPPRRLPRVLPPPVLRRATLVDQLASINWRQARLVALETALIDSQISIQKDNVCELHPNCAQDPYFHLALAWQAISRQPQRPPVRKEDSEPVDPTIPPDGYDISSIELVRRYLVSLDRQYRNTLMNLRQYRKDFAIRLAPKPNKPELPLPQSPKSQQATSLGNAKPPISVPEPTENCPRTNNDSKSALRVRPTPPVDQNRQPASHSVLRELLKK